MHTPGQRCCMHILAIPTRSHGQPYAHAVLCAIAVLVTTARHTTTPIATIAFALYCVSLQAGVLYRDAIVKMYVPNQALPFHCLSQVRVVKVSLGV